jgi:hypothetical protein
MPNLESMRIMIEEYAKRIAELENLCQAYLAGKKQEHQYFLDALHRTERAEAERDRLREAIDEALPLIEGMRFTARLEGRRILANALARGQNEEGGQT